MESKHLIYQKRPKGKFDFSIIITQILKLENYTPRMDLNPLHTQRGKGSETQQLCFVISHHLGRNDRLK